MKKPKLTEIFFQKGMVKSLRKVKTDHDLIELGFHIRWHWWGSSKLFVIPWKEDSTPSLKLLEKLIQKQCLHQMAEQSI